MKQKYRPDLAMVTTTANVQHVVLGITGELANRMTKNLLMNRGTTNSKTGNMNKGTDMTTGIDSQLQKWKCRCSAISKMMANSKDNQPLTEIQEKRLLELDEKANAGNITEKQGIELTALICKRRNSRNVILSDTCISYLIEAYAWETEGMCSITKEMDVEYFDRGRKTEPESIELLSFVDNTPYLKNEERFENDFLSGIPDVLNISKEFTAKAIRDIKSTRDYPTFLYKMHKGLDAGNEEQLQGYGDILECGDLGVAFTLPTMPESIRNGYKMKLAYKMDCAIDQDKEFEKAWTNLERSMIFGHMTPEKRVYKIPVHPFEKSMQHAVYERVKVCREWLFNFHESYERLNK